MFFKQPTNQQIKLQHKLQILGRQMRNDPTFAEQKLWHYLKGRKFGYKFHRQYPIFQFIVDFYCSTKKLCIELDGQVHYQQAEYDQLRDRYLIKAGYVVLRFQNSEVIENIENVLKIIKEHLP